MCYYRHYFQLRTYEDRWETVCLEEPTEFHACERESDCELLDNPFLEPDSMFEPASFWYDEHLAEIYPREKIQLLCGLTSMFTTDSNDIPDYHYDDVMRKGYSEEYMQYIWDDLGYETLPKKICHLPLDFYTIKSDLILKDMPHSQFVGCVNDNQCMSGLCSDHTHLCLRRNGEQCQDNDQCISDHCQFVDGKSRGQCLPSTP